MSQGVGEREKTFAFCKCHTALNGFYYPSRFKRSHTAPDFKFFSGYVIITHRSFITPKSKPFESGGHNSNLQTAPCSTSDINQSNQVAQFAINA
ncbi:hypothetical protein RUM43_008706 [Polyplax serrata]|uniref:Uncharacterized protein n=1 Tax=Polyplax serrata TaxID=468196 RepID=A0AAN8PVC7_POLSC